jgi:phosphoribosylanthranilate isomerase
MFRIKICGVTTPADAAVAVEAGADAIGINFYPQSRRFTRIEDARATISFLPASVCKVGVFVNASTQKIADTTQQLGLECVQLHGNEPAALLAQLPSHLSIITAYRCSPQGLASLADYLCQCQAHGRAPDAVLIDAATETTDQYGGTGRTADWNRIAADRELLASIPLILAGGLTPENVGTAIAAAHPDGVDVASGVECLPGRKDAALVARFVSAAREAFAALGCT